MGKAGRFACIFVPMALSITSLILLVFVEIGTQNTHSPAKDIYFFKADTSEFRSNPDAVRDAGLDEHFIDLMMNSKNLSDYYQVGLWNYCSGSIDAKTGDQTLEYCSPHQRNYYFNPQTVWGLDQSTVDATFGDELQDAMKAYQKAAGWMFTAYAVAVAATALEIVCGFFAIFSRWGSFATTIVSSVSTGFTLAASATSTAIYLTMVGAFEGVLKPYNIHASLGGRSMSLTWLAATFSIASGFFWLLSVCCCSGKSSSPANVSHKYTAAEKTPYTYERVASPMLGASGNPHNPHESTTSYQSGNQGYEPYRHV